MEEQNENRVWFSAWNQKISELRPSYIVTAECIACGHRAVVLHDVLRANARLAIMGYVGDLQPYLRCTKCGNRERRNRLMLERGG